MADPRSRTVRGRQIRTPRAAKDGRRQRRELERTAASVGDRDGDAPLIDPETAAPDPFVETDAVASRRDRVAGWLDAEQPVHVIGPTGSGKTALALAAAAERGRPVVRLDGDEAVDTASLVGTHAGGERYEERDRFVSGVEKRTRIVRERWVDNPLSVAVRTGATLVYNEFSRSDPTAHNVLLSTFEEGVLERPGKRGDDRTVEVHPEFRAILTSNDAEYAGVHRPQDALLDRLVGVRLDYYDAATEREIVAAHVDLPDERIERVVDGTRDLRDELDVVVGTRAAITVAKGLTVFDDGGEAVSSETLSDLFTDVVAPKVAGEAGRTSIDDLRTVVREVL